MILGLTSQVPGAMLHGLTANGVPFANAQPLARLPAVGYLFAAFLGYNPIKSLLGAKLLASLSAADRATLTSHSFFPQLISGPFKHGLVIILSFSIVMCLLAAWASWLRGGKYIHHEQPPGPPVPFAMTPSSKQVILICYDRSQDSQAAIQRAGELMPNEPATVLTVWEPFTHVIARTGAWPGDRTASTSSRPTPPPGNRRASGPSKARASPPRRAARAAPRSPNRSSS